jgi:protein-disulfide isomerase
MLYRISLILLCIPALYLLFEISHFSHLRSDIAQPNADFQIIGAENDGSVLVEFLNYGCGYCKQIHPDIKEMLRLRPNLRYVVRPVAFGTENTLKITNLVLAAGLQDKFWEMHDAVLSYPESEIPDQFMRETASLYGLDVDQLYEDAESEEVASISDENRRLFDQAGLDSVPSFYAQNKFFIVTNEKAPDLQDLLSIIVENR